MQFMTQSIYKNTVLTCTNFLQGVTYFETGDESSINKLSNIHRADTGTASNIPNYCLQISGLSSQQEMLYFGTWKFHKFYGCFSYCKSTVLRLYHLYPMASVPWKIHHTGNFLEGYIFTSQEVIPSTLRPYQEVPWIEPHYICPQLLCVPLQHTSLYSPLIIRSSFHIHADSEDLQYGLCRGWETKWEAISWTCVALALTGTWLCAEIDVSSQHTWVHTV